MHKNVGRATIGHKNVGGSSLARWAPAAGLAGVFLLKFLVVLQLRDHPLLQPDAGLDTTAYVDLARRVLAGDIGLGPGLYFVSPFYIYFLAAALSVFHSFTAVRVLQVSLGTASIAGIFLMTRAWFGPRAAWAAAILAALTGLFTFYETIILQASVDACLTSAGLLTLTLALKRDDRRLAARIGRHLRPRRPESAQYAARRRLRGGGARRDAADPRGRGSRRRPRSSAWRPSSCATSSCRTSGRWCRRTAG